MGKMVYVLMESFIESLEELSVGSVNSVYTNLEKAQEAAFELAVFNRRALPNSYYSNWIVSCRMWYEE